MGHEESHSLWEGMEVKFYVIRLKAEERDELTRTDLVWGAGRPPGVKGLGPGGAPPATAARSTSALGQTPPGTPALENVPRPGSGQLKAGAWLGACGAQQRSWWSRRLRDPAPPAGKNTVPVSGQTRARSHAVPFALRRLRRARRIVGRRARRELGTEGHEGRRRATRRAGCRRRVRRAGCSALAP